MAHLILNFCTKSGIVGSMNDHQNGLVLEIQGTYSGAQDQLKELLRNMGLPTHLEQQIEASSDNARIIFYPGARNAVLAKLVNLCMT